MNNFSNLTEWQRIDTAERPKDFLAYLERAESHPQIRQVREDTYRVLAGVSGLGVDVGCGTGRVVHELAQRGIQAVGIEPSQTLVGAAKERFPDCDFRTGSAFKLPFEDESLGWYRAERVYMHLDDPAAALAEAHRVLAPGATLLQADPDLESITFRSRHVKLARTAITAMADEIPNGRIGTRMRGLMGEAGFRDIDVTARAQVFTKLEDALPLVIELALAAGLRQGGLTEEQVGLLRQDIADCERRDAFVLACTVFVTSARRS
jgi:SAM-dependent methyltransferase